MDRSQSRGRNSSVGSRGSRDRDDRFQNQPQKIERKRKSPQEPEPRSPTPSTSIPQVSSLRSRIQPIRTWPVKELPVTRDIDEWHNRLLGSRTVDNFKIRLGLTNEQKWHTVGESRMLQIGVTEDQEPSTFYGSWGKCGKYGWICTACDYPGMRYHHAFPEGRKVNLIIAPMFMVGTILSYKMKSQEFAVIGVEGRYDMDVS